MRAAVGADDGPEARLRAMLTALAEYLSSHPGTCAGLLGALGATGRLGEVLQANDLDAAAQDDTSPRPSTGDEQIRTARPR